MPINSNGSKLSVETNFDGKIVSQEQFVVENYSNNQQRESQPVPQGNVMLTRRLPTPKPKTVQRTEKTPGAQARKEIEDAKKLQKAQKKDLKSRNIKSSNH